LTSTTAQDRRDALVERFFGATLGTLELFSVYLGRAGFGLVEVIPIENDFFRFYRLRR
jgi:hypothetical protein